MKTKITFLLLAITAIVVIGALQVSYANKLIGTWKLKSFKAEYPSTMTGKTKSVAEADMKDLTGRMKKTTFVFTKDGSLSYLNSKGTWAISNNGKTVDFVSAAKEKSVVTIIELTEHQLVFSRVDDGIKQTFHLVK